MNESGRGENKKKKKKEKPPDQTATIPPFINNDT